MTHPTVRSIIDYLLPNTCVVCDRDTGREGDGLVCGVCRTRWRRTPSGCRRCGHPDPPIGPCRFCADWPPWLVSARSAVWLGTEARAAVHHMKYEGLHAIAGELATVMTQVLPRPSEGILVPVPLSARRLRHRGYNQAEHLARALARRWDLSHHPGLLARVKDTRSQTSLEPRSRRANVMGAFRARPVAARVRERVGRIILVDDILTTGATLVAAADAVHDAGWERVSAMTFARAAPYGVHGMLDAVRAS